ncbi:transcriptional regulator [Kitasatospora acidiphila]|uniref:Transcriptional regulator n=1 Tax=Kitasatospora acidiphila TaxID=2567942 RepID=A0A540WBD0_9ACTN|nr:transcriptional regulator [Kitasatospora acidiphila]TQF06258.1 transcriptional regulator [Kitasatospora acidiphila]
MTAVTMPASGVPSSPAGRPLPRRRWSRNRYPVGAFEAALAELGARGAAGALRGPSGTVWLSDGAVAGARSPLVADVPFGSPTRRPFEAELVWRERLLDAAYYAFGQVGGEFEFHAAPTPDGLTRTLPLEALRQAIGRRRALLDQVLARPDLDTAPVVAAEVRPGMPPGRRLQAVLAATDGQLTPPQLAARLGRSVFGVLLDVRLLAAAGLLRLPPRPPAEPPRSGAAAAPDRPPVDPSDPDVAMLLRIRAALEARL